MTAPLTVSVMVLPPAVNVPLLFTVRLLKVCVAAVPPMVCADPPLKFTVLPLGVNVPPLLVQLPDTLIVLPLPCRVVPLSICTLVNVPLPASVPAWTRVRPVTVSELLPAVTLPVPVWLLVRLLKIVVPVSV